MTPRRPIVVRRGAGGLAVSPLGFLLAARKPYMTPSHTITPADIVAQIRVITDIVRALRIFGF
jgi:hypothetical protein